VKRLERKTTKEVLWPYILRLLQERPMYGYELRQEINKRFGWKPPMVTSYTVLYRLQRDGYLTIEWKEQRGKPARKYYKITKKGQEILTQAEEYLSDLCKKLFKKSSSP
jgi:DNA-binding PadR family transcriptional regulator